MAAMHADHLFTLLYPFSWAGRFTLGGASPGAFAAAACPGWLELLLLGEVPFSLAPDACDQTGGVVKQRSAGAVVMDTALMLPLSARQISIFWHWLVHLWWAMLLSFGGRLHLPAWQLG